MPVWAVAFSSAFVVGSLAEYWGHRLMHVWFKRERHIQHHQSSAGQGFVREFWGYTAGSWPILPLGFLYSLEAGVGFVAGALLFSAFAAYSHELQHQYPECCFWLARPVHHLHHAEKMWHHNFGITFDIWDRVFGTYRHTDWQRPPRTAWRNLLRVKWVVPAVSDARDVTS